MIISYRDKDTERFSSGLRVRSFENIERAGRLKLDKLKNAVRIADIASLPGNRFEALKGDRAGQFSIRINDQWRLCFRWNDDAQGFEEVEIADYH